MTSPQEKTPVPVRRWAIWLGRFLVLPLAAASGGMLYGLYRMVVTGQFDTVAKSYGTTSRTVSFAESPVWFLFYVVLVAALTALVILVTVVMAKLTFRQRRSR
jgi:hypothetical protein